VAAGLAAAGVALAVPAASAPAAGSPAAGHVYLDDNTAGTNTTAAFDRHADRTLTADPGSPFSAGGAGASQASQGAIQVTAGGRLLLTVEAGSWSRSGRRDLDGHLGERLTATSGTA